MDAGTFWVLYNLRILISGVITQIVFNRALGRLKWLALLLLVLVRAQNYYFITLSIFRHILAGLRGASVDGKAHGRPHNASVASRATVPLEQPLGRLQRVPLQEGRQRGHKCAEHVALRLHHRLQSPLFNLHRARDVAQRPRLLQVRLLFLYRVLHDGRRRGYSSWYCISVIVLTAGGGFATAYILKYLSAIMKEYGSSLVMLASTLGTVYVLGERSLEWNQVASIAIVSLSLYLYNFDKIYPMTAPAPSPVVGKEGSEDVV